MATKKKKPQAPKPDRVPLALSELIEQFEAKLAALPKDDEGNIPLRQEWDEIVSRVSDLADEAHEQEKRAEKAEGKYENHPAAEKLAAFEDPANWQEGNRWVPVLQSMTADPLLFIERGY